MSKPINVMHVVDRLVMGGAERIVYELVMNAEKCGCNAYICCLEQKGELGEELIKNGKQVICLNSRKVMDFSLPIRLSKVLKEHDISVIHIHNSSVLKHAVIAAALAKVPVIVQTRHGVDLIPPSRWRHFLDKALAKQVAIVTICEDLKEKLATKEKISRAQITVIPNGIDCLSGVQTQNWYKREELGIEPRQFVFLNVGNIRPEKGQDILVKAFINVARKYAKAVLFICGDNTNKLWAASLKSMVSEAKLEKQIKFLGKRADVKELLNIADVFVLSSITEGMPVSILEAMIAAKPIIVSRVGGIPEMIEEKVTGLMVPPNDVEALSAAMVEVMQNDKLRQDIAKAAREKVKIKFSLNSMLAGYAELYKKQICAA